ncbi:MAG: UbiD family decarboxylase, partial [Aggregatilineales bacterium]
MPYRNLDEFLIRLEQDGELIHRENLSQSDSLPHTNALWIEDENTHFPVVLNIFGTHKRMAWALGLDELETLNVRLSKLLDLKLPNGIGGMMSRAGELFTLFRSIDIARGKTQHAPVQQHHETDAPDATIFPYRTITMAQVISKKSDGSQFMFLSDVEIVDAKTLRLPHHDGVLVDLPVAVVIGGDPSAMWCGFAPLPAAVDPYLLAGWLRGKPVPMANALTQPLRLPADAEIIIEGIISAQETDGMMALTVTAISHRDGAVFPVMCMDEDSAETIWIYKAVERLFMPLLK